MFAFTSCLSADGMYFFDVCTLCIRDPLKKIDLLLGMFPLILFTADTGVLCSFFVWLRLLFFSFSSSSSSSYPLFQT